MKHNLHICDLPFGTSNKQASLQAVSQHVLTAGVRPSVLAFIALYPPRSIEVQSAKSRNEIGGDDGGTYLQVMHPVRTFRATGWVDSMIIASDSGLVYNRMVEVEVAVAGSTLIAQDRSKPFRRDAPALSDSEE